MSPAVRLRHRYVTSGLDLEYFDRLIFAAQSVQIFNTLKLNLRTGDRFHDTWYYLWTEG
jgi:hypothetical protein